MESIHSFEKKTLFCLKSWSACLGNLFEHYDTALFGFLSPFLAPLIFPQADEVMALIMMYAIIPLGMILRPIGAVFFGYIGDNYSRNQALFLSLGGMALVSALIACSPTYQQAGLLSPILFSLGRMTQNFLSAGETIGGALLLLEGTSKKNHDWLSSLYNMTWIAGILLASLGVTLFSYYGTIEWGWRLLYLFGSVTAFFGFLIRKEHSVDNLKTNLIKKKFSIRSVLKAFWEHRFSFLLISIVSGFSYSTYTIALVLMNGFVPLISTVTKLEMMRLNTLLLLLDFAALPFFGWLCSKISREKMMLISALITFISGLPIFLLLPDSSVGIIISVRIFIVLLGVSFSAPFYAWAQELVPACHRYLILSSAYAIGSQIFGGPTAAFSLWLFKVTGISASVCWYWLFLALISSLAIGISVKNKEIVNDERDRKKQPYSS